MLTIIMQLPDGTEVWYEAEELSICRDRHGIAGAYHLFDPTAPDRPAGDYVEIHNAQLRRIAGVGV